MTTAEMYAAIEKAQVNLMLLGYTKERVADIMGVLAVEASNQPKPNDEYILDKLNQRIERETTA